MEKDRFLVLTVDGKEFYKKLGLGNKAMTYHLTYQPVGSQR